MGEGVHNYHPLVSGSLDISVAGPTPQKGGVGHVFFCGCPCLSCEIGIFVETSHLCKLVFFVRVSVCLGFRVFVLFLVPVFVFTVLCTASCNYTVFSTTVRCNNCWVAKVSQLTDFVFLFFFLPSHLLFAPFLSLSIPVVTQLRGHIAGPSPPSPLRFV